jgi:hypothetical protein
MADFTHLAVPVEEWTEFAKTQSPPAPQPGTTQQQARTQFNDARAKLFREVLGPVGWFSPNNNVSFLGCGLLIRLWI